MHVLHVSEEEKIKALSNGVSQKYATDSKIIRGHKEGTLINVSIANSFLVPSLYSLNMKKV